MPPVARGYFTLSPHPGGPAREAHARFAAGCRPRLSLIAQPPNSLAAPADIRHAALVVYRPPELVPAGDVVLRRSTPDDAERLADAVAANLDHLAPWMPWARPDAATAGAQRERLSWTRTRWEAGEDFEYLVTAQGDETLLGVFGLHRRVGPEAIEIGYWLCADATGHGYATTAAYALTLAALALPDVSRVEIHCDEANQRSRKIPQRLGYRLDRIEPDGIEAPGEVGRSMIWAYPPDQTTGGGPG